MTSTSTVRAKCAPSLSPTKEKHILDLKQKGGEKKIGISLARHITLI